MNLLRTIAGDVGLRKVQDRVAGEEANVNLKRCKYARKYGNSDMISLISDEQRLKKCNTGSTVEEIAQALSVSSA